MQSPGRWSPLQALMNRPTAKEATDLLDIVRLVLDGKAGPRVREQLSSAPAQLRADAALHVERWLVKNAERSLRLVRSIPQGSDLDRDLIALVAELLDEVVSPDAPTAFR